MPIKTLIEFGLREKEAKIYIALLELEVAGVSEIARKTGINRSSAYVVLEELKKKKLVSVAVGEGGVQRYAASSPEIFLQQAEGREKTQKDVMEKIRKTLPELKALHKDTKVRPKVYVYTDHEAVRHSFYDIFREQISKGMKKFRVYEDMSDVKKFLPADFIREDVLEIKKSGAKMYVISPDNKDAKSVIGEYKKFGSNDKFAIIPKGKFRRIKGQIQSFSIYEDKIEFFSQDSFLIVIENREIADLLKSIFDLAWEESVRLSKNK